MAQRRTRARKTQARRKSSRATPARKVGAREAPARPAAAAGPPPIAIRSRIPLEPAFRERVRAQLERKLRKFARRIERVSVRFEDVNGPRGGVDTICRAKAVLRRLPTVVVEERGANEHEAFQTATRGLEHAVRQEVTRVVARRQRAAQAK